VGHRRFFRGDKSEVTPLGGAVGAASSDPSNTAKSWVN